MVRDFVDKAIGKVEGIVHLDLNYYIKNASFLILAQILSQLFAIVVSIAFTRLLPREVYGQYGYILSIIAIIAILSLPGMGTAITQAVARGHDRVLIDGTKTKVKWSLLGSMALIGVGSYYFLNGSILLGKGFIISSLIFPFYHNFQTYTALLSGKKQFSKVAKYQVIAGAIHLPVVLLVIYFSRDLVLILIASMVSTALVSVSFFIRTSQNMENQSNDEGAIPFGKKMTLAGIPGVITHNMDKIIIGLLLGFSDVAIYSIALGFQRIIRTLMNPIAGLSFPKLAAMEEKEAYSAVKKRYLYLMLLTAIVTGISIALAPYIIPLFYSQKYADSVLYAQILLAALVMGIPISMLNKALFPSQRKVKEIVKLEVARSVLHIGLIIGFTLKFGLLGVVLSKVVTGIFLTVYSWRQVGWIGPKSSPSPG